MAHQYFDYNNEDALYDDDNNFNWVFKRPSPQVITEADDQIIANGEETSALEELAPVVYTRVGQPISNLETDNFVPSTSANSSCNQAAVIWDEEREARFNDLTKILGPEFHQIAAANENSFEASVEDLNSKVATEREELVMAHLDSCTKQVDSDVDSVNSVVENDQQVPVLNVTGSTAGQEISQPQDSDFADDSLYACRAGTKVVAPSGSRKRNAEAAEVTLYESWKQRRDSYTRTSKSIKERLEMLDRQTGSSSCFKSTYTSRSGKVFVTEYRNDVEITTQSTDAQPGSSTCSKTQSLQKGRSYSCYICKKQNLTNRDRKKSTSAWVQCEACPKRAHIYCVGFPRELTLPKGYRCRNCLL